MKVSDLLLEKISIPHDLQSEVHQVFSKWLNWLSNYTFEHDIAFPVFIKTHRNRIKIPLQKELEIVINEYISKVSPDHHVYVKISIKKASKNDGTVDTQWQIEGDKFTNTMNLILSENELLNAVMRDKIEKTAIHWTSVVMHEVVHLQQGLRSQWKSIDNKYLPGERPNHKKADYLMDKAEIEAHAQQTVSKILLYAKQTDNPRETIIKRVLPLIRSNNKELVGAGTGHYDIVKMLTDSDLQSSKYTLRLYYKKLYEKLMDYLEQDKGY